jgi:hypothetical protein
MKISSVRGLRQVAPGARCGRAAHVSRALTNDLIVEFGFDEKVRSSSGERVPAICMALSSEAAWRAVFISGAVCFWIRGIPNQ